MNNSTGILIFSRTPVHEAQVKKLAACQEKNSRICQHLYSNTINAARKTNLPVIICHDDMQDGHSFSEKITGAIEKAFNSGLQNIVVIGSDCPGMTASEILGAANALQNKKQVVAGADQRGGVYLLGINKNAFDLASFKTFRWQTSELFNDLRNYATGFNFSISHNRLADINSFTDILFSIHPGCLLKYWRRFIHRLFFTTHENLFQAFAYFKSNLPINQFSLRAPPL